MLILISGLFNPLHSVDRIEISLVYHRCCIQSLFILRKSEPVKFDSAFLVHQFGRLAMVLDQVFFSLLLK